METGYRGAFVISWSQTEVDGLAAAPIESLAVGATWSWRGDVVRIDGPSGVLRLEGTNGNGTSRRCAAKLVGRLVSAARSNTRNIEEVKPAEPLADTGFVVTDGLKAYTVTVVPVGHGAPPLVMFVDDIPPKRRELWVVHHSLDRLAQNPTGPETGGVICFTPGTRIETPEGPKLIEAFREGDYVQTKDNGAQPVQWIGSRRMTGARLFAMPQLRPVRIRAGGLGLRRPDQELLVSPEHRMLVKGAVAQALFNTPEVLVSAKDLVNDSSITVDMSVREVTYIHLLLPRHQVLWANGVETESFHPASAALSTLAPEDRLRLLAIDPSLEHEPRAYGGFARRNLNTSEAAILMHEAA